MPTAMVQYYFPSFGRGMTAWAWEAAPETGPFFLGAQTEALAKLAAASAVPSPAN